LIHLENKVNAIAKRESLPAEVPAPTEATSMMAVIARAAADPSCDLDKMERLLAMHERMTAKQAAAEFADALASLQADLPSIGERGDAAGRYKFALWEDINQAIKPILQRHGFALSFRVDTSSGVAVTGVLSHRNGHREETSITLPADASGNKNAVQAVASSVSYGKRYTAGALLNLTSHGEDDDAFAATGDFITEAQEIGLRDRLEACGANLPGFLKFLKVEALSKIRTKDYDKAVKAVEAKERAAK
jgi:hypothetical protein